MADDGLMIGGGIGQGMQAFADTYLKAKQMNVQNQTAQAGLLNAGYQVDPDSGQLKPTEEKQNELNIKKAQAHYQLKSMDSQDEVSQQARDQYTKLLKQYQPGSESLIRPDMSKYEIENEVLPKLKMLNDMQLESKLKGLDIATKAKDLKKVDPTMGSAATAYNVAKPAADALSKLEESGTFDPSSKGAGIQSTLPNIPLVGRAASFVQTPEFKQKEAYENQIVGAIKLAQRQRGETEEQGDAIKKRLFVQPGETDQQTKAAKHTALQNELAGIKTLAGDYANPQAVPSVPKKGLINSNGKTSSNQSTVTSHSQMPIGTVSNGYKKTAKGWIPVVGTEVGSN